MRYYITSKITVIQKIEMPRKLREIKDLIIRQSCNLILATLFLFQGTSASIWTNTTARTYRRDGGNGAAL